MVPNGLPQIFLGSGIRIIFSSVLNKLPKAHKHFKQSQKFQKWDRIENKPTI